MRKTILNIVLAFGLLTSANLSANLGNDTGDGLSTDLSVGLGTEQSVQEPRRWWGEIGGSIIEGGVHLQLKYAQDHSGWGVGFYRYRQSFFFSSVRDVVTGDIIRPEMEVISVFKLFSSPFKFGSADVGIGLGYAKGNWSDNCSQPVVTFLGTSETCEDKPVSTIGIPVQLAVSVGKYVGAGFAITGFYSEDESRATLSLFVPFGRFAR